MSLVDVTSDQFKSRLRPFGISFEKSLSDLIKGIRANNDDKLKLSQFFNASIQECRNELKLNDLELKSMAILKLTYLEMYGFDLPFMSFQILEVMSSIKFQHKRIGYLAAMQILSRENNDDVLMLMTNLLKKDLNSSNHVEVGLAISCLSAIVTRELAQDVVDDLMKMFSHSKPFIRKKAILASYKVFLKYPESLKLNYDRLVAKLDDSEDISVVSATVSVMCELAKKQPSNYIELTPKFFALLTNSSNNWMIIRLLKLFSSLSLIEPRIKKKLQPAVIDLMTNTKASSLIYECINCILSGNMLTREDKRVSEIMVTKLLGFVTTNDQNLKYVSILAFIKIINIQPELIRKHELKVLEWLKDEDLTIRSKSLQLVDNLIDRSNIMGIISSLLVQLADDETLPTSYKLQVCQKILNICGSKNFSSIPNFDWYLATLKDLLHLMRNETKIMLDISSQFSYVGLRVPDVRGSIVEICSELIMDKSLPVGEWWNSCMWCISEYLGEYFEEDDGEENEIVTLFEFLVSQQTYKSLISSHSSELIIPIFTSSLLTFFVKFINKDADDFDLWNSEYYSTSIDQTSQLIEWLEQFQYSLSFNIQERSIATTELLRILKEALQHHLDKFSTEQVDTIPPPLFLTQGLPQLYNSYDFKPIAHGIQQRLGAPELINVEEVFNESEFDRLMKLGQMEYLSEDDESDYYDELEAEPLEQDLEGPLVPLPLDDLESVAQRRKQRIEELKDDPYYIISEENAGSKPETVTEVNTDDKQLKKKKKKKVKKDHVVILQEEDVEAPREQAQINIAPTTNNNNTKLKFKMDDSQLMGFDLKAESSPLIENTSKGEYEVEKLRQELLNSALSEETETKKKKKKKKTTKKSEDVEAGTSLEKKPKKSVKKRKAVIS